MKKLVTVLSVVLVAVWCLGVLLSWLLSAMMVDGVRSLLTGEGIRWLLSNIAYGLASPLLVWLLLAAMAVGCLWQGGLATRGGGCRRKRGLRLVALLVAVYVAAIALLVVPPQAVLLSATGTLWPSPFSRALAPLLCFGGMLAGAAYGLATRTFTSIADIVGAMVHGLQSSAPFILLYMLAALFYQSVRYIVA